MEKNTQALEEDWSENKFDISLNVLMNEYSIYIQTMKDTDEKANKYLVVISIFFAGFFTLISSSLRDQLRFSYPLEIVDLLSYFFIFLLIMSSFFGFFSIYKILNSLKFVESRRMPDINMKLDDFTGATVIEYKNEIVKCYQEAINFLEEKIAQKQSNVKKIYPCMQITIICILSSCFLLFLIQLLG